MWLSIPSAFAPALECLTPHSASLAAFAQSVTSSGKHTPQAGWSRSWKRDAWMQRLSGLTWEPSTADLGAARWIASLEDCPASRTQSPASASVTTITEVGASVTDQSRTSCESFQRLDPPWSLLKMSQLSLLGDFSDQSEKNYQQWVTESKGRSLLLRKMWARAIGENEFSSSRTGWMTPDVPNGGRTLSPEVVARKGATESGKRQVGLENQSRNWPTPAAQDDNKSPEAYRHMREFKLGRTGAAAETISSLQVKVQVWRTPDTNECGGAQDATKRLEGGHSLRLQDQAHSWPLESLRPVQSTLDGRELSPTTRILNRRLNPAFAAWLMGLPGWWTSPAVTNSVQSEMDAYRLQSALLLSRLRTKRVSNLDKAA